MTRTSVALCAGLVLACSESPLDPPGPFAMFGTRVVSARDEARDEWVVLGGAADYEGEMGTWIHDGHEWQVAAVGGPEPRTATALAWDPNRRGLVLFGGHHLGGPFNADDTWLWRDRAWSRIEGPSPPGRAEHALVWVPPRGALLLMGGFQDDCRGPGCQAIWWLGVEGWREGP